MDSLVGKNMYKHKKNRCGRCKLHEELCICTIIPKIETRTKLLLIMHFQEIEKPSNTGRLAHFCLSNSAIRIRGEKDKPLNMGEMIEANYQSLLLYPSASAQEITPEFLAKFQKPIQLIVPDGTWGQARRTGTKISKTFPEIPHVKIPFTSLSQYRLRKESSPEGLATFEAIARAFGVLEGKEVQQDLEKVFLTAVERLLWARGKLAADEVFGGLPAAAISRT